MLYLLGAGKQKPALLQSLNPAAALPRPQKPQQTPQRVFATPGKQPPELALCCLGGILAARSGQGLDGAGAWVDQVAGHHAAEAPSHHLQRRHARISVLVQIRSVHLSIYIRAGARPGAKSHQTLCCPRPLSLLLAWSSKSFKFLCHCTMRPGTLTWHQHSNTSAVPASRRTSQGVRGARGTL